jgi:pilus assembly protein CpaB
MRIFFALVLIVGFALAGFAVYLVRGYTQGSESALAQAEAQLRRIGHLSTVMVLNRDVKYGQAVTRDDVRQILWQAAVVPKGAFADLDLLFPKTEPGARYALRQMEQFEPLTAVKLSEPGQPSTLTARLGRGLRGFAISVNAITGVSGFVQPGDQVDVYWTGVGGTGSAEMTRLIESSINIIAVDQTAESERGGAKVARTVTVAASPEQVARLAQAQASGSLALALVGANDDAVTERVEIDNKRLLGIEDIGLAPVFEKSGCVIRTRRGLELDERQVPCMN